MFNKATKRLVLAGAVMVGYHVLYANNQYMQGRLDVKREILSEYVKLKEEHYNKEESKERA